MRQEIRERDCNAADGTAALRRDRISLNFLRTKAGMEVGLERGRGGLRATGLDQFELVANQGLVAKIAGEGCY